MSINTSIKTWAHRIKRDVMMLWFARQHADVPLLPKMLCVIALLYALSPIDLIPDFIPVLGYLDEILLLPALIWLAVRMLPTHVVATCRAQADDWMTAQSTKPKSYLGAAVIISVWLVWAYLGFLWLAKRAV